MGDNSYLQAINTMITYSPIVILAGLGLIAYCARNMKGTKSDESRLEKTIKK